MDYHKQDFVLQLLGVAGEHYTAGAERPLGPKIELKAGSFADPEHPLGVCNLSLVQLPEELLEARWVLTGYQLSSKALEAPQRLPLVDSQLMHRVQMPFIPAGCIQPLASRQPIFSLSNLQRNPCPGWAERIHLYCNPKDPFYATSVMYLDSAGQVSSVEMRDVELRHAHPNAFNRIWISLGY